MSGAMADHKLFSNPVSVDDAFKRADGRTWIVLSIAAVAAIVLVVAINLFTDKPPPVRWPTVGPTGSGEPKVYDVAPPATVPPPAEPSRSH